MFKTQRINDVIYCESSDGRFKLIYPHDAAAQVKGLVDAAELMLPKNDPQLLLGAQVSGAEMAEATFGRIREIAKLPAPVEKKPKKHREAKKLVDSEGTPFQLSTMILERVKAAKGHKIPLADMIEEIKHHYNDNLGHAKNAIRISAMKSELFSLAGDSIVQRIPSAKKVS